jgi:hypothetical protein
MYINIADNLLVTIPSLKQHFVFISESETTRSTELKLSVAIAYLPFGQFLS